MTTKILATCALVLAVGCSLSSAAIAKDKHRHRQHPEPERYVPADRDLLYMLFGGPRYYDKMLVTTAAGACSYNRIGPDANAMNKVNDHWCGK
ncbi:hypothetical protein FJV76_11675 [Mesorhizobium sp. WSM4303]|uniref:hypothetical protein n=1 Tax=unclassified Mesorhizobium TaxID=325217 RepID=UPI00115D7EF6|nr:MULTISPECIES: hypothetical protein [unclassified Mesorhizobium]TRC93266.1 hypothetical protein FJV77_22405 [Mesorhizobium sp. WSM4306]TRD04934.1 hypothetical protein FJV76_11675 [Mesorhizobium sp. WSM4303]